MTLLLYTEKKEIILVHTSHEGDEFTSALSSRVDCSSSVDDDDDDCDIETTSL